MIEKLENRKEVLRIIENKNVLDLTNLFVPNRRGITDLKNLDVAITFIDYVVENPFSFIVILRSSIISKAIILPEIHIGVYHKSRVFGSFEELIDREKENLKTEEFVIIGGESLTADIEKKLISGVHGPQKVFAIEYSKALR